MTAQAATTHPAWLETYEAIDTTAAGGPESLQRVHVLKLGNVRAAKVLVLLGGREGGANAFRSFGRDLARATPDLQVWSVDRREQNLADLSKFGDDPAAATEYYLEARYTNPDAAAYAGGWGLAALVNDLREVVAQASDGGRRQVFLGGVSVGANAVLNYAAWDFDGTPGYRDLAGLVIADGGVYDAYSGAGLEFGLNLEAAQGWLGQIEDGQVFETATSEGIGLGERPESAAVWLQLVAQHALRDPDGPAAIAERLPENIRPKQRLTNRGLLGWLMDAEQRHPSYAVHAGTLSDDGGWVDGGPTPLDTVIEAFAGPEPGAWVWYTLNRLMLDYVATIDFAESDSTRFLGLPISHTSEIDIPLYAFESGLAGGTVGRAAQQLADNTAMPTATVHSDFDLAHQDLMYARPADNAFLRTLAEFIQSH
jgi:hypothetical protein